jgi:hypothetical protein
VAYRHLGADQWFVGTDVREAAAPFGQPLFLNINSLDATVSYAVSDRVSLTLTLPFYRKAYGRSGPSNRQAEGLAGYRQLCGFLNGLVHVCSDKIRKNFSKCMGRK